MNTVIDELADRLNEEFDRTAVAAFGFRRPLQVSKRLSEFVAAYLRVSKVWESESTRGDVLLSEIAALGPVSVKVGQTLSQRPDILPEDVCESLKTLQTSNTPFPDADAWKLIAEECGHDGPIAPGLPPPMGCANPDGPPLFQELSASPIAAASLGQVYRGRMHDGVEVAVKVQRPTARRQIFLDFAVIYALLALLERAGKVGEIDLLEIFDLVADGIVQELDFRNEVRNCSAKLQRATSLLASSSPLPTPSSSQARNAAAFEKSLAHLGYATVPRVVSSLSYAATA